MDPLGMSGPLWCQLEEARGFPRCPTSEIALRPTMQRRRKATSAGRNMGAAQRSNRLPGNRIASCGIPRAVIAARLAHAGGSAHQGADQPRPSAQGRDRTDSLPLFRRWCGNSLRPSGGATSAFAGQAVDRITADGIAQYFAPTADLHKNLRLARARILQALSERTDRIDSFIDFVIAWESIVGYAESTTFLVSGAMSMLLAPDDPKKRSHLFSKIKKFIPSPQRASSWFCGTRSHNIKIVQDRGSARPCRPNGSHRDRRFQTSTRASRTHEPQCARTGQNHPLRFAN